MNKIILFSFAFFFIFPVGNSFGESPVQSDNDVFIFVQTIIRNSDGALIVYLESTKFTEINFPLLKSFLDVEASQGSDFNVTINGKEFQVIRRVQFQSFNSEDLAASTILSKDSNGNSVFLARFAHDGYYVVPGDTIESIWTFIRPVS